jgi:hypothetical protein
MTGLDKMLQDVAIPKVAKVRQAFDPALLEDPYRTLLTRLNEKNIPIRSGMRIAITGGSRGIVAYKTLMKAAVDFVRFKGGQPFIVPAMGSHGGGTAEGQYQLLESLGITEKTVGAPVISSMDVMRIGDTGVGLPVFIDKNACQADGILLLNRIKTHTSIQGDYESGIVKMLAIGLAKHKGAEMTHRLGPANLGQNIVRVAQVALEKLNIVGAIASIENGYNQIADVYALEKDEILTQEPVILARARKMVPQVLLDHIDALIVAEFGKEISGNGMDPAVVGRHFANLPLPVVRALGVLRLTEASHGNAVGIGLADFIPRRFRDSINLDFMYINCVTGMHPRLARIPITVNTEKQTIQACLRVCGLPNPLDAKLVIVRSTKYLEELYMSPAAAEAAHREQINLCGDYTNIPFDGNDKLNLF